MEQPGESRLETFLLDSAERGRHPWRWLPRVLLGLCVVVLLAGWYWSREPGLPPSVAAGRTAGAATTGTLLALARTLVDKPGGFLANDVLPPGVLLDDMPAFEAGMRVVVRDTLRAMRRDFSQSPSQATEDPDLVRAGPRFNVDGGNWLTAEAEYRDGIAALDSYARRLEDPAKPGAYFHARADSLGRWLDDVDRRLASYAERLAAASANGEGRTPWLDVDDEFHEARGYGFALLAQLRAVRTDFAPVLAAAQADAAMAAAEQSLAGSQQPVRSPMILNGSEFGILANHSLVMANYLARARASLLQVRAALPR